MNTDTPKQMANGLKSDISMKLDDLYKKRFNLMRVSDYDQAQKVQELIENLHAELEFSAPIQDNMDKNKPTPTQLALKEALVNYKIRYGSLLQINQEVGTTYQQLNSFIAMSSNPQIRTYDLIMNHIQKRNAGNQ